MANIQLKLLLLYVCILVAITMKGVHGQCSTPPMNEAVYEGTQNTLMTCNSPTKVSWTLRPTTNEVNPSKITDPSDTVAPSLTNLYNVNQTNLNIKIAQSSPEIPPITTSGIYVAQFSPSGSDNKFAAKLIVVREPPTCDCTAINSTNKEISCSVTYADGSIIPIYATITWTADGNFIKDDTLNKRTRVNGAFTSTSTITVDANDPAIYQCIVTFAKPTNIGIAYIATNAPTFTAFCTVPNNCVQCLQNLKNVAVREGQTNTIMNLATDPQNVKWTVRPTSSELHTYTISDYDGPVDPSLTGLYDVNQTGLIIKEATAVENGYPVATAGLYTGQCANNPSWTGAKLLVVRSGPQCSNTPIDSNVFNASNVSCSIIYADSTFHPIYPIVTWKLNGAYLASYTLQSTRIDEYVWYAQSNITDTSGSPSNYECQLTFAPPTDIQYEWIATNAPEFNETCSISTNPVRK